MEMKEIMGCFTKTEWHWEFIKKYDSESHKPQAFIGDIAFKTATAFCYLMNKSKNSAPGSRS